jgi:dTDP-4-amino-4,6-dideoxygalactose transaminase
LIPFNRPYLTGNELKFISESHINGALAGDGQFTKRCHTWLENQVGCNKALLTHSCTAALEIAALLLDIQPGDEVIMPSFTFVSTANAFVLRGGVPVFVDIREDTLNINENLIDDAITSRTRAIVPVHYAGVACEMDTILSIAKAQDLMVIEDAAQGVMSTYKGQPLGGIGDFGAYSFHETKNVISGEGGALLVNDSEYILRAEILREKGTDRGRFFRGEVDKYTWQDAGSSFLPGEITAAFLWAQLQEADRITQERLSIWWNYHKLLESLEERGLVRRPIVPEYCQHNGHMYYVLLDNSIDRQRVLREMKQAEIWAVFHYVPLHNSPGGNRFGRVHGVMDVTKRQSESLIRLPMWVGLSISQQIEVVEILQKTLQV